MAMSMDNSILSSETIDENESKTELNLNLGDNISTGDNNSTENKKAITEDPSNENNFTTDEIQTDPVNDWTEIWELITCPVCSEPVKPPVNFCISGHRLSSKYCTKVPSCSICRCRMSEFRCITFDKIILEIPLHCVKEMDECQTFWSTNVMDDHNKICENRNYQCPVEGCTSEPVFEDFPYHMWEFHAASYSIIKKQMTEIIPLLMKNKFLEYFFFEHIKDIIFFLHYIKQNEKYYFWVTYISLIQKSTYQRYELVLTDLNIKSKSESNNMKILKLNDASIFDNDNFFEVTEDFFDNLQLPILTMTIMDDNSLWSIVKQKISLINK